MQNPKSKSTTRKNRIIVAPFDQDQYTKIIFAPCKFREGLDNFIKLYPEIFPPEIDLGYQMKDIYHSKKLSIPIRRIEIAETNYTLDISYKEIGPICGMTAIYSDPKADNGLYEITRRTGSELGRCWPVVNEATGQRFKSILASIILLSTNQPKTLSLLRGYRTPQKLISMFFSLHP